MTFHEISLSGKSALITGGSAGIGLSVAEKLCRAGNAVAIVARKKEQLNEAEQYLKACLLNKEQAKLYNKLMEYRSDADYNNEVFFEKVIAEELLYGVEAFNESIKILISKDGL